MKSTDKNDLTETHPLFPSGEWEGFYTYEFGPAANRHKMSFALNFQNNMVDGNGCDDVGLFKWHGQYDKEKLLCIMTKYYASHTVLYEGVVDGNGIWGTWTMGGFRGGFHFWPKEILKSSADMESVIEAGLKKGIRINSFVFGEKK